MKRRTYLLTLWLLAGGLGLTHLRAQQSIQTAGGNASSASGSISYTVGQVAYLSTTGPGGSSTAGIQQPYELFVLSSATSAPLTLECATYPNPTAADFTLRVGDELPRNLTWHLTDLTGRALQSQPVAGLLNDISLAEYPAGAYLLTVRQGAQQLKTFKIIKQ